MLVISSRLWEQILLIRDNKTFLGELRTQFFTMEIVVKRFLAQVETIMTNTYVNMQSFL